MEKHWKSSDYRGNTGWKKKNATCLQRCLINICGATLSNSMLAEQSDLVTVTSHIACHTAVSSAFTCSSGQRGFCAAESVGRRGLKTCSEGAIWDKRGRVLPLLLVWFKAALRLLMDQGFGFQKDFSLFFVIPPVWIRADKNSSQQCGGWEGGAGVY